MTLSNIRFKISQTHKSRHQVVQSAGTLLIATCLAIFPWQASHADSSDPVMQFSVNGVNTDIYGSGGTGYTGEDVRQSDSSPTGTGPAAMAVEQTPNYTQNQQTSRNNVPFAGAPTTTTQTEFLSTLDKQYNGLQPGQLPATRLDSFVAQAGGMAELIYGDEGIETIPPLFGFTEMSRINTGITSGGLTTGHQDGSLPEAWGYPQ
jgi:opacity protein-like surface antigen